MKRFIVIIMCVLLMLLFISCGSSITQSAYDALLAENEELKQQFSDNEDNDNNEADYNELLSENQEITHQFEESDGDQESETGDNDERQGVSEQSFYEEDGSAENQTIMLDINYRPDDQLHVEGILGISFYIPYEWSKTVESTSFQTEECYPLESYHHKTNAIFKWELPSCKTIEEAISIYCLEYEINEDMFSISEESDTHNANAYTKLNKDGITYNAHICIVESPSKMINYETTSNQITAFILLTTEDVNVDVIESLEEEFDMVLSTITLRDDDLPLFMYSDADRQAEHEASVAEIDANQPTRYKEGTYKIGTDIDEGEYILDSNGPGYFEICSDSSGSLDAIISNDNFYGTSVVYVRIGQYLTFENATAYISKETPPQDVSKEGMFRVGIDIEPGEYKLQANGDEEMAYFAVYSDATHQLESIISNDNFYGTAYVTVSNGEYLQLKDCTIAQ